MGDVVDACLSVLEHREAAIGEAFNIGSESETTTARAIEIVEQIIGSKAKTALLPPRPGDQLRTRANIDKARRVLGYEPATTPEKAELSLPLRKQWMAAWLPAKS